MRRSNYLKLAIAIAVFTTGSWFTNTQLLVINQLECQVEGKAYPEICQQLDHLKGKPIFFFDLEETSLYQDLLKNDQGQIFRPDFIQRQLPGKLIINLIKEQPKYQLVVEDQTYWINNQNYFGQNDPSLDLPRVRLSSSYQQVVQDRKVDPNFNQEVIDLLEQFEHYQVNFKEIYLSGQESKVILENDIEMLFELGQDSQQLAAKVKLISLQLEDIKENLPQNIETIDLRFDMPVVKTKKNQAESSSTG